MQTASCFFRFGYYTRRCFFHLPLSSRMMNTTARTIQSMVIATQTPKTPICPPVPAES